MKSRISKMSLVQYIFAIIVFIAIYFYFKEYE